MEQQVDATRISAKNPQRLLLAGLGLGLAFDLLFNGKPLGVSVVIFACLLLAGLALATRWEGAEMLRANLWLQSALLFFALMSVVRASGFLLVLNLSVCLFLASLIADYARQRPVAALSLTALCLTPLRVIAMALYRGGQISLLSVQNQVSELAQPARRHATSVLKGLLIALPVVLVFAGLLASADLIFADRLEQVFSLEFVEKLGRWLGHAFVALPVGFFVAGGLVFAVRDRSAGWTDRLSVVGHPRFAGITEATVVMNSVNLLFLFFVIIQVPYLFGGRLNINPSKFTYAEYARRGFGELVIVAILTLGLVLLLSVLAQRRSARDCLVFNVSGTLLVGLTWVMLASAFKRLLMYEMAYGFTRLRIYPHVFMVWLGVVLAWFVLTLWRRPERFAIGLLVAGLGFVATLNLLNPDAVVVRQNFRRADELMIRYGADRATAEYMDTDYFRQLSEDAVPALIAVADQSTGELQDLIEKDLRRRANVIVEGADQRPPWTSFHLSRARAQRLLLERYHGQ